MQTVFITSFYNKLSCVFYNAFQVSKLELCLKLFLNFPWPCQLGSTAIGIQTAEGVCLAVEKRITSPLMEPNSIEKIVEIDSHIGTEHKTVVSLTRQAVYNMYWSSISLKLILRYSAAYFTLLVQLNVRILCVVTVITEGCLKILLFSLLKVVQWVAW